VNMEQEIDQIFAEARKRVPAPAPGIVKIQVGAYNRELREYIAQQIADGKMDGDIYSDGEVWVDEYQFNHDPSGRVSELVNLKFRAITRGDHS
jgi:hypothetical protein